MPRPAGARPSARPPGWRAPSLLFVRRRGLFPARQSKIKKTKRCEQPVCFFFYLSPLQRALEAWLGCLSRLSSPSGTRRHSAGPDRHKASRRAPPSMHRLHRLSSVTPLPLRACVSFSQHHLGCHWRVWNSPWLDPLRHPRRGKPRPHAVRLHISPIAVLPHPLTTLGNVSCVCVNSQRKRLISDRWIEAMYDRDADIKQAFK